MLAQLLSDELVACHAHAKDWREATVLAGRLFERAGKADATYTDAMIKTVEDFGAYIVLEEGIAMPHARSEGNVREEGICVVTLDEPVVFGNEEYDPVWVLVGICAPNPNDHLKVLSELAAIFDDEDIVEKLRKCEDAKAVRQLISLTVC